jgi:hypothetical protein
MTQNQREPDVKVMDILNVQDSRVLVCELESSDHLMDLDPIKHNAKFVKFSISIHT